MPVISFQFQPDLYKDPQSHKLGAIYRPYILVKLGKGKRWSNNFIKALLDSGADHNVFPKEFAEEIGIDYKKGSHSKIVGVGGQEVDSYIHVVTMRVEKREFETVVQFANEIQTPLLGREGFFNYFNIVSFAVKKRLTELRH